MGISPNKMTPQIFERAIELLKRIQDEGYDESEERNGDEVVLEDTVIPDELYQEIDDFIIQNDF